MSADAPLNLAETIVKWIDVGIFVLNKNFEVTLWNNFMAHHSSRGVEEVVGKNLFELFPELPKPWFTKKVNTVFMLNNFAFISWEHRPYLFKFAHNRPITGGVDHMYQNCMLLPVKDAEGKPEAVVVMLLDSTDVAISQGMLRDAMDKLADTSNRDGLTRIYNRRYLENRLSAEYDRVRRYGGTFSLVMFDLDFFKKVNDNYGHLGGDAVLVDIAQRVTELLRSSDIVGRYGGEEFGIILPETPMEGARIFADRLRAFVEQAAVDFDSTMIPVTISMGVAEYGPNTANYQQMIHEADISLYASKAGGRNRVTCYAPELEKIAVGK